MMMSNNPNLIGASSAPVSHPKDSRNEVAQMELEPEENCCVCYTEMNENDNLAYCRFGCGRNLHTECMERWVKHKT